ncbi:hypothetical protein JG688_00004546 [Phytophthora aleatoria]|uniref:WW domain-containing protein n=1 Tax=Phytophthora aleatoria TaxID=2496075 RepID=A0A8J5JAB6_9STRA|nr:hypothetical protein JG688_00004546 [Phytophthora aleatoria]
MRGAGRRGGRGGGSGNNGRRRTAAGGPSDPKTSLVDEWRAHEEDCAARVLQNVFRAFLSRQRMARLLLSVYEKHYDPIRKQHYYVNTLTDVSTWEKPLLLVRFLPGDRDIARGRVDLSPKEAAQRIQRVVRAFLAQKTIRQLVRENYMKLFDPDNRVFYYLNTRTGERSEQKPPFFRPRPGTAGTMSKRAKPHDDDDDLEIESFYFRKAVCKISSEGNPYGSGIIGRFCGILCVLTDGKTLADEIMARSAQVTCNYADERVAFPILLAADTFFAGIKMPEDSARLQPLNGATIQPQSLTKKAHQPHFDFALCALNEDQFVIAAGDNVRPLRFEMNDRKLGCAESESLRMGEHLEIVGHPHGKLQALYQRQLARLAPNSINPQHLQYDRVTETGSAGCGVFTRGGKLLGIQQFSGPKEPPPLSCWYIKPILNTALTLVSTFIFLVCQHLTIYSSSLLNVVCSTPGAVYIDLVHCFHCVKEAIKRMRQQRADSQTQFRSVQWIYAQLEKSEEADRVEWESQTDGIRGDRGKPGASSQLNLEQQLLECQGLELLLESIAWFPDEKTTIALTLRLFVKLSRLQAIQQDGAGEAEESSQELPVVLLCLELVGVVLSDNGAAKVAFESCSGVELVLSLLESESYRHEAAVVGECCYVLAVFSYENASIKWEIAEASGFALLQRALLDHRQESRVLYWALITFGNVAYGLDESTSRPQLEEEITSLALIDSVCQCRVHFLSRLHELELSLVAAQAHLDHLHAIHVGEETRNELDASTQLVDTLTNVIADWKANDVAEAADYALRYLLTEEQRRVQAASKRLMRKFLRRTLSMAVEKWSHVTEFERHRAIFLLFIHTVRTRQLRPAFRRWEQTTREMRKHKSILQTIGSGLAMDLTKKKKERYRMLVLQK